MLQHALFSVPRYDDGYCLDDNARALLLTTLIEDAGTDRPYNDSRFVFALSRVRHSCVQTRTPAGSGTSWRTPENGPRSAAAKTVRRGRSGRSAPWWGALANPGAQTLGSQLFHAALPALAGARELQGMGVCPARYPRVPAGVSRAKVASRCCRSRLANRLLTSFQETAKRRLAVVRGRSHLRQRALAPGADRLGQPDGASEMMATGLSSPSMAQSSTASDGGLFRPDRLERILPDAAESARFRPATPRGLRHRIAACLDAWRVTGDDEWPREMWRAFSWFTGENHLQHALYDPTTGGCRDGLHADRPNENQGAESTLSFLLGAHRHELRCDAEMRLQRQDCMHCDAATADHVTAKRSEAPPPLRVAVLAPDLLAGAAPPLRALGAVRFPVDRGPGAARTRRHPLRHGRLDHAGRGSSGAPHVDTPKTLDDRREGVGVSAHLGRVRARRRVRPHPQQLRLLAPQLLWPRRHTGRHHDPRLFVRANRPRLSEVRHGARHYVAISDADRHPSLDYAATIHHGIDMGAFAIGTGAARLPPVLRPHSSGQGHGGRHLVARRAGLPLVIAGIVQDQGYFERAVEPHIDGDRVRFVGPVGPEQQERAARRRARPAPSGELRRAVRLQRGRGDGLRDSGDRAPDVDRCRSSSRRASTAASSTRPPRPCTPWPGSSSLDAKGVRASVERRFDKDRMVDDYIAVYRRILGGSEPKSSRERRSSRDPVRAVSAGRQLLAGSNGDGMVDRIRPGRGRGGLRSHRRRADSTQSASSSPGRTFNQPHRASTRRWSSASSRPSNRRAPQDSQSCPRSSRAT